MTGFLQRLAANLAGKDSRVHPIVGGLYSKEPSAAFQEHSLSESVAPAVSLTAGPAQAAQQGSDASRRPLELRDTQRLVDIPDSASLRTKIETTDIGTVQANPGHHPGDSPAVALRQHATRSFRPLVQAPASEGEDSAAAEDVDPAPHRLGSSSHSGSDAARSVVRDVSVLRQPPDPATSRAQQYTGNEVQIHIGRIEVTAVPPTVPRPAPAGPRNTMSLDEYLARHDGRRP